MLIFKTKLVSKWAKKERLADFSLRQTASEMQLGLTGSSLGENVYKKRISLNGRGKHGGVRSIVAYKSDKIIFFIFGYAKNEKENIPVAF